MHRAGFRLTRIKKPMPSAVCRTKTNKPSALRYGLPQQITGIVQDANQVGGMRDCQAHHTPRRRCDPAT